MRFMNMRMSRRFVNLGTDEDGYWACVGSPADIRKVMKIVGWAGVMPLYSDLPVMREGRRYMLMVDPEDKFWTVSRKAA